MVTPDPENFLHTLQTLSRAEALLQNVSFWFLEVLVGAHGANMAKMLFAPDNMKVVEIVPQALLERPIRIVCSPGAFQDAGLSFLGLGGGPEFHVSAYW